jgi:hypothetical protein
VLDLGTSARVLDALAAAVPGLERAADRAGVAQAVSRGHFTPSEEERLMEWFARALTVRAGLWQVIRDASGPGGPGALEQIELTGDWRRFLLGYGAACALVRLDRFLVEELAIHATTQRKLNEGARELGVPRKQFTRIFKSLSNARTAALMYAAMVLAERERARLVALADDADVGFLARGLADLEASLDRSKRGYARRLLAYGKHSLARRGASAKQRMSLAALEAGGRVVAELHDRWSTPRVGAGVRRELEHLLRPGDVLVTRHAHALTNLFLPGFWPHVALYVGLEADRERLGVRVDPERGARWSGERCVLEALKDGVLFRPLSETLSVDAVAVIRPKLSAAEIARGIERAARHEGKLYNFDFDFFRSDRLVCSEVVYRAYDGLGGVHIELTERAGRPTLSAEDLLDLALDGGPFHPIAVFGAERSGGPAGRLTQGPDAAAAIAASYRNAAGRRSPGD